MAAILEASYLHHHETQKLKNAKYLWSLFFFFLIFFLYLFLALLRLHCYMGFSLIVASRGYFLVALHRLLIEAASVFAEHRL